VEFSSPEIRFSWIIRNNFKSYCYGPRDSLASRYKIGSPGSRRYRNWQNEFFLIQNLSETESATDCEDDWDSGCEPSYGLFALVLDDENKDFWDPFVDITEDQQNILLEFYENGDDEESSQNEEDYSESEELLSPDEAFSQIRSPTRRLLTKHRDSRLLQKIDEAIFGYSNGILSFEGKDFIRHDEDEGSLIFSLTEKFHRLLLHSLCEYYDLVSYSFGEEQDRQTVVYKRAKTPSREMSLLTYLNGLE